MLTRIFVLTVGLISISFHAIAEPIVTITFDDLLLEWHYESEGFEFSAWAFNCFPDPDPVPLRGLDGGMFVDNDNYAWLSVTRIGGGAFNAISLDINSPGAVIDYPSFPGNISAGASGYDKEGNYCGGNGGSNYMYDWETIDLTSGALTNIYELRIYQGVGGNWNYIDNLTLQAVPEPTTMLLFGIGIAGLAAVGRKRRK